MGLREAPVRRPAALRCGVGPGQAAGGAVVGLQSCGGACEGERRAGALHGSRPGRAVERMARVEGAADAVSRPRRCAGPGG